MLTASKEAAAIYTLQTLGSHRLCAGKTFVVCDAGGGTVDLISYKIIQLRPKLQVGEATEGTGGKCGSSMLNKRFRQYLKRKIGSDYWTDDRLVEANNAFELVNFFESHLFRRTVNADGLQFKQSFMPEGEPLTLRVEMPDNVALGVRRGRFKIGQADMRTEIFEPVILDIISLVREQIRLIGGSVTAVLLVGGFGQSQYLKSRIKAAINSSIQVLQPANGWTAVVQGAAMIGLSRVNISLGRVDIATRVARKHYGTELATKFDEGRDDRTKR